MKLNAKEIDLRGDLCSRVQLEDCRLRLKMEPSIR